MSPVLISKVLSPNQGFLQFQGFILVDLAARQKLSWKGLTQLHGFLAKETFFWEWYWVPRPRRVSFTRFPSPLHRSMAPAHLRWPHSGVLDLCVGVVLGEASDRHDSQGTSPSGSEGCSVTSTEQHHLCRNDGPTKASKLAENVDTS